MADYRDCWAAVVGVSEGTFVVKRFDTAGIPGVASRGPSGNVRVFRSRGTANHHAAERNRREGLDHG